MATSYTRVYEANSVIRRTPTFKNYDEFNMSKILFEYLKYAISYFKYDCLKDLNNRVDPVYDEFISFGDDVETVFELPTIPKSVENIDIWIDDSRITDFTFDETNNSIIFTTAPKSSQKIKAQFYSCGYFVEDLDVNEITILAEGMIVPYLEQFANDENVNKYIVTGTSIKFYSQANHVGTVGANVSRQYYDMVEKLIIDYTYKNRYHNYDNLVGQDK